MSKTSDLAAVLDDLMKIGKKLTACGEELIKAVSLVKDCLSGNEEPADRPDWLRAAAPEPEPEPGPSPELEAPAPKTYAKEEVRQMLADISQAGHRDEIRTLVQKYSSGRSFKDIDPGQYPALVEEAQKYNA